MFNMSLEHCEQFSRSSEFYDAIHAGKGYDGEAAVLLGYVPHDRDTLACEWGAGTGEFVRRFRDSGCYTVGTDISPQMRELSRDKGIDIGSLSITDSESRNYFKFDHQLCLYASFCYATAEECTTSIAMQNFARHSQPGGLLIIEFLNAGAHIYPATARSFPLDRGRRLYINERRTISGNVLTKQIDYCLSVNWLPASRWRETHKMRMFRPMDAKAMFARHGFEVIEMIDLQAAAAGRDKQVTNDSLYFTIIGRKVA
jgi:SAM-dependent methyltransferase